ncbi:MAG: hypothetical protein ACI9BW_000259 [Gammaproteobacteria bacterium]
MCRAPLNEAKDAVRRDHLEKDEKQQRADNLMLELIKDLWDFMRERKKFWLAPIILVMLLLGALLVFTEGSAVAPFIYTLF